MSLVPFVVDEPTDDKTFPAAPSGTDHTIEIALANGRTIKVPTALDATPTSVVREIRTPRSVGTGGGSAISGDPGARAEFPWAYSAKANIL